jgi:hypothetical protein
MRDPQGNSTREAWILCLVLGTIMINFPFIHIFNSDHMIFGIPVLVIYFFVGWPASILIIWVFVRQIDLENGQNDEKTGRGNPP